MPLLSFARFLASLLSLLILAAAIYLLWSWYDGRFLAAETGDLVRIREPWRLWTGGALLAWSFLGRFILPHLLARPGGPHSSARRGEGHMIAGPSGSSLYVERHGPADAPPLIFTHGWGMDSTFWHAARRDLSDRFQVIVWDLPGLGRSKLAKDGKLTVEGMANDLAALAMLSGSRPPVLIGHSIGGMIIQTVLRDHPQVRERLAGVVLLNTTYTNPLKTMTLSGAARALQPVAELFCKATIVLQPLVWLSKWQSYLSGSAHLAHRLGFGRYVTRSQLEHATLLSTRNPPAVEAKGNIAMFHWDSGAAVAKFDRSILVVGGDKDLITKLEASRAIAAQNELATLEVVPGVNHLGPLERADAYNLTIAEFCQSVQPRVTVHDDLQALWPEERQASPRVEDRPPG